MEVETEVEMARPNKRAEKYAELVKLHLEASLFVERKHLAYRFQDEKLDRQLLHSINAIRLEQKLTPYVMDVRRGEPVITIQQGEKSVILQNLPTLPKVFLLLMTMHVEHDHASTEFIKEKIISKADIGELASELTSLPNICYDLIQMFCDECIEIPQNVMKASLRGSVGFMYQMNLIPHTPFSCLLVYLDENTEFVFLRPIDYTTIEICNELYKLFMQIGVPDELTIIHTHKQIGITVKSHMRTLFPSCALTLNREGKNVGTLIKHIMDMMGVWLKDMDSKMYQLGCSVVQNRVNNRVRATMRKTQTPVSAFDLFYKNPVIFSID